MKRQLAFLGLFVVAAVALVGCQPGGSGSGGNEIVVGAFGDTSGDTSTWGVSTRNAVLMAAEEINAAGGINGRKVRIQFEDNRGEASDTRTVVSKLIDTEGAVALIGEVASKRSLAGGEIAQRRQIPMVSPASTNPDVTKDRDFVFRVCFVDDFQGSALANFAKENLKADTAAILTDNREDYSVGLAKTFRERFVAGGGRIVAEKNYNGGDTDYRAQLNAIKAANPKVILVPGYYGDVGTIARQARELGITAPFLGGDGWDSPKLVEGAGTALEGSYFTNHYSLERQDPKATEFVKRYTEKYNLAPDAIAALGYDAAMIVFQAIKTAGEPNPKKIRDALAQTRDFEGVTGKITIDENRNASKPIVILQVRGKDFKFVDEVQP